MPAWSWAAVAGLGLTASSTSVCDWFTGSARRDRRTLEVTHSPNAELLTNRTPPTMAQWMSVRSGLPASASSGSNETNRVLAGT